MNCWVSIKFSVSIIFLSSFINNDTIILDIPPIRPISKKVSRQPNESANIKQREASEEPMYTDVIYSPNATPLIYDGKYKAISLMQAGSILAVNIANRALGQNKPHTFSANELAKVAKLNKAQFAIINNFNLGSESIK